MMLPLLIIVPLLGALIACLGGASRSNWPRWLTIGSLVVDAGLLTALSVATPDPGLRAGWLAHFSSPWIPQLGIGLRLDMDGLSLLLLWLTLALSVVSVVISWKEITEHVGFFHVCLLATTSGVIGVFLSTDLFLFFFFWEIMLVPMYFLVAIWGHERRVHAAIKFFLFTQGSGLLMLLAIFGLVFAHRQATGQFTFDYFQLLGTYMPPGTEMLLMLGFFIAFAVKLPVVPFHSWLPDTHTQAPTAGSVLLAGILLKTGAYGLIRFTVPLFPDAARLFTPVALALGVIGILYGALLAMAQTDMKRLVAYSSVSHLGFVLLGIFAWNGLALQGVVIQMIAHGISTGALFILVGTLQDRLHTRDLRRMGGLWHSAPHFSAIFLFFGVASLGLPGLGNFVGEFLTLLGTYRVSPPAAILGAVGLVMAAVYVLMLVQRSLLGPSQPGAVITDLSRRHMAVMAVMIVAIIAVGVLPQPIINVAASSLDHLVPSTQVAATARPVVLSQANTRETLP
ncbi:NADH-quinone oxidoreductase subunit M [Lichenicola cladoniae]|uniref:NADH-quinone oxidoreductase subunit M n=1 Tax=Lichenicola cladoniae TaxID=1484109 RepID=A0A6M8HPJ8_9PROT|nr:NADH-quinone oxidoreductase subunit M [Lichenicola cladoniae]NPD69697.1 NADH-quinone oxidoreductase subunit M [Acetobacteraceae bacterium]QKE90399.1 NADH-quinone oxidoreductase subunit M [Lichenicola cladoniae]